MNKFIKASLIVSILVMFALSLPNVYTKHQTENGNNKVELAVDFKHIYLSTKKADEEFKENLYQTLKDNGITSIGLTENSLMELETRELVHVLKGIELKKQLWNEKMNFQVNRNHTYVVIPNDENQEEVVQTIVDSQVGEINIYRTNDTLLLEVEDSYANVYKQPLLYLESDFEHLSKDFKLVPRISNKWDERLHLITTQLKEFHAISPLSPVVFSGTEVEGFDEDENIVKTEELWNELGIGMIEIFSTKEKQLGSEKYAYGSDFNIVRVHSVPRNKMEDKSGIELKRLVVKAANERNIRMFYINIPFYDESKETSEFLDLLSEKLSPIYYGLDENGYKFGTARAFQQNGTLINEIGLISAIFGTFLMFALCVYTLFENTLFKQKINLFSMFLGSGLLAITFGLLAGKISILNQVASLGITILLPIWASIGLLVYLDKKNPSKKSKFTTTVLPLIVLYVIGLSFLTGLNYDLSKITYTQGFKGVSLTLLAPIAIVSLYLLYTFKKEISILDLLKHKIRIIDVLVMVVLLAFFVFYISRSGNSGSLLPFEAQIRNWLEDTLNVRPRTKEIFFAFPIMTIMIIMWKQNKWVRLMLPITTLGLASICNTFTHFHTPIYISLTRTIISIGVGTVIGMVICMIVMSFLEFKKTTPKN